MARKPPPSLPDVFAKPGAAPPRGAALEELPEPPTPTPRTVAPEPEPEVPSPPPPPVFTAEPVPAEPADLYIPPPRPRPTVGQSGLVLAVLAVVISLTAPFWEEPVLSAFGIRSPIGRAAEQSTLAVMREEARTTDIGQHLNAAAAQIDRQQAEFATAMQSADRAAAMVRTMALVRLSETLRRPMPFAAELALVQAGGTDLGDMKPLLDQIQPYANTGIPGIAQLRQDFAALLQKLPKAEGGGSWMGDLASWAQLRRPPPAQETAADPSLQLLRSASDRLADLDVAGAVQQTQRVSAAYRPIVANWLDDAQARIAADAIADETSQMVTQALRRP